MVEHLRQSPEEVFRQLWHFLHQGAMRADDPFHTPVLATIDAEGMPTGRTVVLRRVEAAERWVIAHTDMRSPKVQELRDSGVATWVFYDPHRRLQFRITGPTTIHHNDALANAQWESSKPMSRLCYLHADAPGAPIDSTRTTEPLSDGRANFGVVRTTVERIDWLWLNHAGHRRLQMSFDDQSRMTARWIAP
jgi:pyridoxine/pyridoxamine 5'-phosphate oxidase